MAYAELVDRSRGERAVHRLNPHELTLLSIEVGLKGPTIRMS